MSSTRLPANPALRAGLVLALAASIAALAVEARGQATPAPAAPAAGPPAASAAAGPSVRRWPREVVVIQGADDAADLLKKLDSPEWILSRPPAGAPRPVEGGATTRAESSVVEAVRVEGAVEGDDARVALLIDCALLAKGPQWVPLRINVPVVLSAREGDREVELRKGTGDQWEARLDGAKPHRLRIEATVPVRVAGERRTLELPIPEAASTSFDLALPRRASDVDLGPGEPAVRATPIEGGAGVRVAASVRPRSPLVVNWSEQDGSGAKVAPLLSAQVEMAVDVDAEGATVRSSWAIACARGAARSLKIRLDDDESVTRLQLNDQFPGSGIERSGGSNLLTIFLSEPMRPGESRRLVLETRRPASPSGVLSFSGYPLTDAGEQTGFLGAIQGQNQFVSVQKAQGLRRIDPRELPTALKARPGTTIALQFLELPFGLALGVEASPPIFRAETSAALTLDPDLVRNETTMDVHWDRGTLFEIEVAVPPELKVVSIGPPELVEAVAPPRQAEDAGGARILKIRLTPPARDRRSFALKLTGRQAPPAPGDVRLGLFSPRGAVATAGSYVVQAGRDASVEPLDPSFVREPAAARPEGDASAAPLRLSSGRNATMLDVRLERRPLEVRRETRLAARFARRTVEVRQETRVRVRHGVVSTLEVALPAGISSRWQVSDEKRPIRVEELDATPAGPRHARLDLERAVSEVTLTFQYRVPVGGSLDPSGAGSLDIPWISVDAGAPGPCQVELSSDPEVEVAVDDPAWSAAEPTRADARGIRTYRIDRDDLADSLGVKARLMETMPLPSLVVPRAFIRAALDADGGLRVRAWYAVESHNRSLAVGLPPGSAWLRARVDGKAVERVDDGPDGSTRIDLPADGSGRPALVDLEYRTPAESARRPWTPPSLLDGAEVLQTYWLVQFPPGVAAAGPPPGWNDENRWAWDSTSWTRVPVANQARLAAWAAGPSPPSGVLDEGFEDEAATGLLFSRAGGPSPMSLWIFPRALAVLACSGLTLLAALGMIFVPRTTPWIVVAGAAVGVSAAAFAPAGVSLYALQASMLGVVLGLVVHASRLRAQASAASASPPRPPGGSSLIIPESSQRSSGGVGSDDSTAIRVRTTTTMDYLSLPPSPDLEPDSALGSRRAGGLRTE